MGQMCLVDNCKNFASIQEREMYYCLECYDNIKKVVNDDIDIIYALENAEVQINYLRKRMSVQQNNFTKPTSKEAIKRIKQAIEELKKRDNETKN